MAAEVYTFMDAFDAMIVIVLDYPLLLKKSMPIYMFTDSKQLFDVIIVEYEQQKNDLR